MLFPVITLEELEAMAIGTIIKAKEQFNPVATFALFSGGNDSTAMLHLVKDHVDAAVHIVTGIGIPQTTEFVRQVCKSNGTPLVELRTDPCVYRGMIFGGIGEDGYKYPDEGGFPGPAFHHMAYNRLKLRRLEQLQREHSKSPEKLLLVSGVRKSESQRRKLHVAKTAISAPTSPPRCAWANPILHFTKSHLADYRLKHGVPQSDVAALIHKSGECLCGAFAKKGELEEIEFWFPETGKYIRSLELEVEKRGKRHCRWGWGHDKLAGVAAPGPLCSSCELFDEAIAVKEVMG